MAYYELRQARACLSVDWESGEPGRLPDNRAGLACSSCLSKPSNAGTGNATKSWWQLTTIIDGMLAEIWKYTESLLFLLSPSALPLGFSVSKANRKPDGQRNYEVSFAKPKPKTTNMSVKTDLGLLKNRYV